MGTHVHPWLIHVNVWQNKYSIAKHYKVKIKIQKKMGKTRDLLKTLELAREYFMKDELNKGQK